MRFKPAGWTGIDPTFGLVSFLAVGAGLRGVPFGCEFYGDPIGSEFLGEQTAMLSVAPVADLLLALAIESFAISHTAHIADVNRLDTTRLTDLCDLGCQLVVDVLDLVLTVPQGAVLCAAQLSPFARSTLTA